MAGILHVPQLETPDQDGRMRSGSELVGQAVTGAAAGAIATAVMTTLMKPGLPRVLGPRWRPRRWVPRQVADWLLDRTAGVDRRRHFGRRAVGDEARAAAALLAHFGYGAAAGAVYGLVRGTQAGAFPDGGTPAAGAAWGLVVWAAGYEGWMPRAGVRPATSDFPPSRWPLPIANHVVYGMVTAGVVERLRGS